MSRAMFRAILAFLALPAVMAGVLPWLVSMQKSPRLPHSVFGAVPLLVGAGILLASVISFYRKGKGTLAPWDPPKVLVVSDLYRFNRNPMYLGIVILLLGWAVLDGNLWNYAYALCIFLVFHIRVISYEEKEMRRLFPDDWSRYCRHVPRWGIRLSPYSG